MSSPYKQRSTNASDFGVYVLRAVGVLTGSVPGVGVMIKPPITKA